MVKCYLNITNGQFMQIKSDDPGWRWVEISKTAFDALMLMHDTLEDIASSPEESHPCNLLKLSAHQALEKINGLSWEREPTVKELIAESEVDALEPEEDSDGA